MKLRYLVAFLVLAGCGRYLPPVAPESLTPSSVVAVVPKAEPAGITFTWNAPETDVRGKKLKYIDGYKIYRADVIKEAGVVKDEEDIRFNLVGTVKDEHLIELKRLQDEAEKEGKIVRKVKIAEIKKQFSFLDSGLSSGTTYVYKIVPFNQGEVEGEAKEMFRVKFSGETSLIEPVENRGSNSLAAFAE